MTLPVRPSGSVTIRRNRNEKVAPSRKGLFCRKTGSEISGLPSRSLNGQNMHD